ncbi:uracil-DNA glycosylase [Sphingomonas sp. Leaf407]|uniref:uracil-DNA glycosylase n=1 Tax=unclassified Sphingomonas TaxID=196159 RepID=UPI0007016F16|nr:MULTISPECIES: uracil-DNA glycosylase [unclassified Sphingomonas]KQN35710.1 uracil-DNA glycosylase [Sphingomonas sp. Leaf42]KQT26578.1 uracil-DNA glycosylase [Sphingomonas sp. Leaf407]
MNDTPAPLPAGIDPSWGPALSPVLAGPGMAALRAFLTAEKAAGKRVLPHSRDWFAALATPLDQVRVVILGQDPYHGPGQAHGLSFSVRPGVAVPPSLRNIYKELHDDLGIAPARHGYLGHWAEQGVLLLNSVLTVEQGRAASHAGHGWEAFTDAIVHAVAEHAPPSVFMLWGSHAQKKAAFVQDGAAGGRHLVLKARHPSPLSAHSGWFGSRPFSQANAFLEAQGRGAIDWAVPAVGTQAEPLDAADD